MAMHKALRHWHVSVSSMLITMILTGMLGLCVMTAMLSLVMMLSALLL
jgi:hypothetical protein